MHIDHVLAGVAELDAAARRIESEHGLVSVAGGRHDGLGTANRIVPLGDAYLELIAVVDADEAAGSPLGMVLADRIAAGGLIGWAVAVDDADAQAARLGIDALRIAREGLSARIAGAAEALARPPLPFFIARDPGVPAPGEQAAKHWVPATGIAWLELGGDAAELDAWLEPGHGLPLRVTGGEPGVRAVGIALAGGGELALTGV